MPIGARVVRGAARTIGGADSLLKQGGRGVGRSPSAQGGRVSTRAAASVAGAVQTGRSVGASAQQAVSRRMATNMRMPNMGRSSGASATARAPRKTFDSARAAHSTPDANRPSVVNGSRQSRMGAVRSATTPRRSTIGIGAGLGGFGVGAVMGNAMFSDGGRPGPAARSAPSISRSGGSPTTPPTAGR